MNQSAVAAAPDTVRLSITLANELYARTLRLGPQLITVVRRSCPDVLSEDDCPAPAGLFLVLRTGTLGRVPGCRGSSVCEVRSFSLFRARLPAS
jgi:hypothetical protein